MRLDERQRAMLLEIGVRVFQPDSPIAPEYVEQNVLVGRATALVASDRPGSSPLVAHAGGIESMGWDTLAETVAQCRACQSERRSAVE